MLSYSTHHVKKLIQASAQILYYKQRNMQGLGTRLMASCIAAETAAGNTSMYHS